MLKHQRIHDVLRRDIDSGLLPPGARLPTEAELVQKFAVSRITVTRALSDLQKEGLIERRAGAGSFVRRDLATSKPSFGLLIPELGEVDIFEPLCRGMMSSPDARDFALLWGNTSADQAKDTRARELCSQFISRQVAGVFFAPLEFGAGARAVNANIARALTDAHIPLVLLDRSLYPYPRLAPYDLVGIDNRSAAYVVTHHLLTVGAQRVAFVGLRDAASTVDARESGYRDALFAAHAPIERQLIYRGDIEETEAIKRLLYEARADAIVCANDRTAGKVMHTLRRLGVDVPGEIRLAGIDDAGYAEMLPVPLTTMRQPTQQLGDVAISVMRQRLIRPDFPVRETRLPCELVIRESCGAKSAL